MEQNTYRRSHENQSPPCAHTMPPEERLIDLAELYKVFGDSTRIRVLYLLLEETELCVHEIAARLHMTQSAISHQLRILKVNRLVKYWRAGRHVMYTLDDEHVASILSQGLEHIVEKEGGRHG